MTEPQILSSKDGLTGFHTKQALYEYLSMKTAAVYTRAFKLSVIILDLDNFKGVNDHYGHLVGDDALRHFCAAINAALKGRHFVARYGGDEFVIALEDSRDYKESMEISKRIKAILRKSKFLTPKGHIRINTSIGIATYPDDAKTSRGLLEKADAALYHAKSHGKNKIVHFRTLQKYTVKAKIFGLIKISITATLLLLVILSYRSTNSLRGIIDYFQNNTKYISYLLSKNKNRYDFSLVTLRDNKSLEGWILKEDAESLVISMTKPVFCLNPLNLQQSSPPTILPKKKILYTVNLIKE